MKKAMAAALALVILSAFSTFAYAYTSMDFYKAASRYKAINPFAATIHCALETGNWKSRLWTECFNGAGIKTNKAWRMLRMPYVLMLSPEDEGGVMISRISSFRKYRDIDSFLMDYSRKIRDDYPVANRYYKNVWGYIAGLHQGKYGKWATDRRYFEKLAGCAVSFAPQVYGADWHFQLEKQFMTAKGFGILEDWQERSISERLGN